MNLLFDTYVPDIMHSITSALLIPTLIVILCLLLVAIFFIGQIIVEIFTERRHYIKNRSKLINDLNDASYDDITTVIDDSQLLRFQKASLIVVARNLGLPDEALFSLAQMEIGRTEKHYRNRLAWTDTMSKIAPMLGLMGTLIPLGPGIVALGQNDVTQLSQSLLVAFDATVCGLVVAVISLIISKIRSGWYGDYVSTLESLMGCLLERADEARKSGIKLPTNYTGDPIAEFKAAQQDLEKGKKRFSSDSESLRNSEDLRNLARAERTKTSEYVGNSEGSDISDASDRTAVLDDKDRTAVLDDKDRTAVLDDSDITQTLNDSEATSQTAVIDLSQSEGDDTDAV